MTSRAPGRTRTPSTSLDLEPLERGHFGVDSEMRSKRPHVVYRSAPVDKGKHVIDRQCVLFAEHPPMAFDHGGRVDQHSIEVEEYGFYRESH
jgi:hypothetical protein